MPNYDKSTFSLDDVTQTKTMNRVLCSFLTLIFIFIRIETSSNELSKKFTMPNGLSNLESQISMMSNDPEAERRLRDRWNAFVAETTKELDFDLKVFISDRKFNLKSIFYRKKLLLNKCSRRTEAR